MIKIQDLNLLDIAPKSTLVDETTKWIYQSIQYVLKQRNDILIHKFFLDLNNLTEEELESLLWEYHVDYVGENSTREQKTELIKKAIYSHFNKGTLGSVKAICNILFGNAEITEWFEYNGNPGYFRISTTGGIENYEQFLKIIKVINEYKNLRSWLDRIRIVRKEKQNIYFSDFKKRKIKYKLGSTDVSIPNENILEYIGILHRSRLLKKV